MVTIGVTCCTRETTRDSNPDYYTACEVVERVAGIGDQMKTGQPIRGGKGLLRARVKTKLGVRFAPGRPRHSP
jgi:hypothetical protein